MNADEFAVRSRVIVQSTYRIETILGALYTAAEAQKDDLWILVMAMVPRLYELNCAALSAAAEDVMEAKKAAIDGPFSPGGILGSS